MTCEEVANCLLSLLDMGVTLVGGSGQSTGTEVPDRLKHCSQLVVLSRAFCVLLVRCRNMEVGDGAKAVPSQICLKRVLVQ